MPSPLQAILVPQGQEYQAVNRAAQGLNSKWQIIPIPMGNPKFSQQLEKCLEDRCFNQAILLGLCGSLSNKHKVGDVLIYQTCKAENSQMQSLGSNSLVTYYISQKLGNSATLVDGLSSDRLICEAQTKKELAKMADR